MLYQTKEPLPVAGYSEAPPYEQASGLGSVACAPRRESAVETSFVQLDEKVKYLVDRIASLQQRLAPILVNIPSDKPLGSANKEQSRPQSAISQGILEAARLLDIEAQKIDNILSSLTI